MKTRLLKRIDSLMNIWGLPLFLITVFIFSFPSINLPLQLRTHLVAKLLTAGLFFYSLLKTRFSKGEGLIKEPLVWLMLIYFFTRAPSIINAVDLLAHLSGYQRFVVGWSGFFIAFFFGSSPKTTRWFLIIFFITSILHTMIDWWLYIDPYSLLPILKNIVYAPFFYAISANIDRGRVFFNLYSELVLPITIYLLLKQREIKIRSLLKIASLLFFDVALFIIAFLSGWRIRVIDFLFSNTLSFIILTKYLRTKIHLFVFTLCLVLIVPFMIYIVNQTNSSSLLDRFKTSVRINEGAIRPILWDKAWQLGLAYPLTGVGFDNFIYYFTNRTNQLYSFTLFYQKKVLTTLVFQSPHNILFTNLAESGWLALLSFTAILIYCVISDVKALYRFGNNHRLRLILIIQFWTLLLYGLFHPTDSTEYYFLLFVLRGLIAAPIPPYDKNKT